MKKHSRLFRFTMVFILNLSLSLILFFSPAFAQYITIDKFHTDIMIHEDSSFIVREKIDVKFDQPRHGIYREIPFLYRDELGKTLVTPIKVLSVKDGVNKPWKYKLEKKGNMITIRIGDANKYVSSIQTYVITYQIENAILFFDDHDELYWNVTGNEWKAPIREASASVILSVKNKSKDLWAACFEGHYGSKEQCNLETYGNSGKFFAKRNLDVGEGLTIAFGWDKGLVSPPSSWKRLLWTTNIKENWVFLFPILSLIYMFNLWYRKGRDPRVRESVSVMYEPPKFDSRPLIPAEVGILIDEKLDPKDITSTIVGLAVKGYIQIEETEKKGLIFDKKDYDLIKVKDPDANLSPFEIELMKSLFSDSPRGARLLVSSLKNRFYKNLSTLKKTLYGELIRKKYFLSNPETIRQKYVVIGFVMMLISVLVLVLLAHYSIGRDIFAGILTGLPIIAFARFMPVKTKTGSSAYMDILGFQEFMNRAEKDRLERMGDKDLFSKFLPYAIALDVADHWGKAFEEIYQNPPDWYVTPGGFRTFSPYTFSHSLRSVTSSLSSAMFSSPRGSGVGGGSHGGLGGGGSSGGGFGGGGGGSW